MAKQSGLGSRFLVAGYDLSGDLNAIDTIASGTAMLDGTDITMGAHARIPGLRDGSMSFTAFFDLAGAHPVLSALPLADQVMTALLPPLTVGAASACCNAKQLNYDPSRGSDGSLMLKVDGQGNGDATEWGVQLTPGVRADSGPASGASLDNGAATNFGAQAYLQVTALTGSTLTVIVQHAPDNVTWSPLITFAAVAAAPAAQRAAVANTTTVQRYLRVTTTGTFTAASLAVMVNRNTAAGVRF